jgi:hypothetical protein
MSLDPVGSDTIDPLVCLDKILWGPRCCVWQGWCISKRSLSQSRCLLVVVTHLTIFSSYQSHEYHHLKMASRMSTRLLLLALAQTSISFPNIRRWQIVPRVRFRRLYETWKMDAATAQRQRHTTVSATRRRRTSIASSVPKLRELAQRTTQICRKPLHWICSGLTVTSVIHLHPVRLLVTI